MIIPLIVMYLSIGATIGASIAVRDWEYVAKPKILRCSLLIVALGIVWLPMLAWDLWDRRPKKF